MLRTIRKMRPGSVVGVFAAATLVFSSLGSASAQAIETDPGERWRTQHSVQAQQQQTQKVQTHQTTQAPFEAECPPTLKCVVVPAAYQMNGDDPGNFGNYSKANRPVSQPIKSIVTHDTEGDLQSVLDWFQNPQAYVSAHYVIAPDGTVYQMVQTKDVAWQAGNWWYNSDSIGIEHVGYASQGHTSYTKEMYKSSSTLIKWLSEKFDIPKDRQHAFMGHDNIPAPTTNHVANMHVDPGPYWNWQKHTRFASMSTHHQGFRKGAKFVTVAPLWHTNKQQVTGCWPTDELCVPDTPQSSNFAYLHTEPNKDAPFITDPMLGQGSTSIANNAARVYYGQTFAMADMKLKREGIWYQIWVNGIEGWLLSPWKAPTAFPSFHGQYATTKDGEQTAPVYGQPLPELADYPSDFNPPAGALSEPTPIDGFTINAGQRYKVIDGPIKASNFYDWTFDDSTPYEGTTFVGDDDYYLVQYGNRQYFVKADDVTIQ